MYREELIKPSKYTRPGKRFTPRGIALHWVGGAGHTAQGVRNWFDGSTKYASAHFVVDEKEAILCVPMDEMAYHVGAHNYTVMALQRYAPYPNAFLIGIEMCHPFEAGPSVHWVGKFSLGTLHNTKILCAGLCERYDFDPIEDIVRHHDITGKECPRWFVRHEDEYDMFKIKVKEEMIEHDIIQGGAI